jgi:cytochrome c biogenesis protein CcdA
MVERDPDRLVEVDDVLSKRARAAVTLVVALLGGLISCLSPCVGPVLPVFVANVGGASRPSDV